MKTIAILKEDLDKLEDWTIAYPKERVVGTKYKISSPYRGGLDWFVGEVRNTDTVLKLAIIVDEIYQK